MLLIWITSALALDIYEGDDLFAALAAASPGDEIIVHAGTYSTQSSGGSYYREVVLSGTEAAPIVVRAADGEAVLIEGDPAGSQNIVNLSGSWYTWSGFEMRYGSHGLRLGSSSHGQILDNDIHDTADVGLSMNIPGATYDQMLVSGNQIHDTSGTGEGLYLGCNDGGCAVTDSIIQSNHIHDTADTEQGDGIELKSGSTGNLIRQNIIQNTNYPGITMYGTYGGAANVVEGNLIIGTVDNGIQIVGDVGVYNNVIIDAGAYGIYSKASQGAYPDALRILHNTVLDAGEGCFRANDWDDVTDAVVANNLLLCEGGTAIRLGGGVGVAIWSGNMGLGDAGGLEGWTDGGSAGALVVNAGADDVYPVESGLLVDAGDPDWAVEEDIYETPRSDGKPDIGAFEWSADGGEGEGEGEDTAVDLPKEGGCGCASSSETGGAGWVIGLAGLAAQRRRPRLARPSW